VNKYASKSAAAQREAYRLRSCAGKRRYPSREAAYGPKLSVYACQFCGGWHRSSGAWATAAVLERTRHPRPCP